MFFSIFSSLFFWFSLSAGEEDEDVIQNELYCAEALAEARRLEEQEEPHDWIESVSRSHKVLVDYIKERYSVEQFIQEDFRYLCERLFPKLFLQLCGFYEDFSEANVYGDGEFHDKIRVTYINGVANIRQDNIATIKLLSESHGGINVHYVFRPTEGWTQDIFKSTLSKLGFISPYAFELAKMWKRLIQEMGGVENGCLIMHYAHSIGGTDSLAAKGLLTVEEARLIRMHTIGSPTLISPEGLNDAKNFVNVRDAIPYWDPLNYWGAVLNPVEHIIFIGDWMGYPFFEHALSEEVHISLIKRLGELFQLEFLMRECNNN